MTSVRLTSLSHGAGCACKLGPGQLAEVMEGLTLPAMPPEVLLDASTSDDAAVYQPPGASHAIAASTDFFTPIVDDPFDWGRIAAANAVSDLYAVGAKPVMALNLVAWPVDDLPLDLLGRVLEGGAAIATQVGMSILGGHSITDPEPKYGMVVIGLVEPNRIVRNSTARAGDSLYLTKPLGLGMISTAIKREVATGEQIAAAVDTMTTLNADACGAMLAAEASAATDVTGFGLLGHLHELATASGLAADIRADAVPFLPGVGQLAERGVVAGGTQRNHAFVDGSVAWGELPIAEQLLLADAQTSGGLLIATGDPHGLERELDDRGVQRAPIGALREGEPGEIRITGRVSAG